MSGLSSVADPGANSDRDANLERLELAAEASGICFWEWDLLADRLTPDRFLATRFGMGLRSGCTPAEELAQLLHPQDVSGFRVAIDNALKSPGRTCHRCRMVQLDGAVRHVDIHLQVDRDRLCKPTRVLGMVQDVTNEVESAERLAATVNHKRQLLERLSVAIQAAGLSCWEYSYAHDADGTFTWVDSLPDGSDPRDLSLEEVNRLMMDSAIPEDVEALRLERARAIAAGAETLSSRIRRRMADGCIRHFQIYQKFFRDEHGRVTHALGARRDVTDEVHAAELLRIQKDELQAAQRRLERASLSVQEGHWEIDLATGKHWASSNYYVLLGYSPDETSLNTLERVRELIHPDDLERAHRSAWDHLLENKPHDVELRVRTKDGDYRWFRLRSSSERDENGVALRMSGSITEIERQKAAEDALREAQARFERAIHGTKDGLWEVDMVARKMWLSPRLHELLGYEVGELGDHHDVLRALVHPDDLAVADAAVARQFESDEPLECEVRMRRKSGDYRWFSFRGSASSNERPVTRVSGSMQDVTRERLAQDALIRASEEARSANQAKSVFLANMSHEIRTPMNGIIGMATLLLDTRLDAVQREYAETIQTSSQSLLTIINDILDFSKIEAGKLDIEAIDFDVRTVVEEVMSTLEFQASSKGLQLTVNVAPGVPAHVIGDPQRIRQCLINLVGNAVKFTREGGVAVAVSLSGTSDDEQPLVRFEVRDTGIGIDPQSVKSLFQPFVQADSSTTRYFGGTGLGLSIVRGLVEMMGGEVGASSEPGKGSTFWFTLPLKAATASARRPAPQGAAAGWDTRRFRGKVLLVEDNGVNQRVAQRFLERLGCTVVLAQNGAEGVKAWEQEEFALVLMDIQMPVMDGYTATRNIRLRESDGRRTPIVALTANAMKGQLDRCHEAGMDGLLTKPIVLERLREVLERFGLGVECHEALPEQAVEALVTTGAEPPAVDCSELAELAGEDFEFVQSVVLSFEKSMAQLLSTMRAAAGRGEMQQVARAAHQVKGAAANLHAKALSALAADIEASARSLCATDLEERLKSLAREIDRATIALHAFAERARQRASA